MDNLQFKKGIGKGTRLNEKKIIQQLSKLKIGEIVKVEKSEFDLKYRFSIFMTYATKQPKSILFNKKFRTQTFLDNSGWVVKRVA